MRADGSIVIEADLTVEKAEKKLEKLKGSIEKTEDEIAKTQEARDKASKEGAFKAGELDEEKRKLVEMRNILQEMKDISKDKGFSDSARKEAKAAIPGQQADIADQAARVRLLQAEYNKVENAVERYDRKLADASAKLAVQKTQAGELITKINSVSARTKEMAAAQAYAGESMRRFGLRLKEVVRSALIFTVISQSAAKLREWMGKVIKTNDEAQKSFAQLKGALLTLAQPLVSVVIPAFTTLVNLLAAVAGEAARLVSALFGTTVEQSAEAAESLQAEVDALNATGTAAKKAGSSLASFDEINTLSSNAQSGLGGGGAEIIAPDFTWMEGISERLEGIAKNVLLIGTGLALWKVASSLPGQLGNILTKVGGLMAAIGGAKLAYEGLSDAWENGVDWVNLAELIVGVTAAAFGLYVVFGSMTAGIALVVGGIAMLVTGFKDVIEGGVNLQNMLLIVAGIIGTGLGFFFLTGSVIPLVLAGIASVVTAIAAMTGNGEQLIGNLMMIFEGLADFLLGVFTLDLDKAGDGICKIVGGVINTILTVVGSLINAIIKGLNWLISKINSIGFSVPNWVPGIGGKSFKPKIPSVKEWEIPQLATGAVIPPNREFLAVLGDQKHGTNIEAPEDLIRKIVREEAGGMNEELLRAILAAIKAGQTFYMDGDKVARNMVKRINDMAIAAGEPVLIL